ATAPRRHGVDRRRAHPGTPRRTALGFRASRARRAGAAAALPRHARGDEPARALHRDGTFAWRARGAEGATPRGDALGRLGRTRAFRAARRARRRHARERSARLGAPSREWRDAARSLVARAWVAC